MLPASESAIHLMPPKGHRARSLAILLLVAGVLGFGCLAVYLGQDGNWDLRNYHWYNAYAFLNGRYAIDMLPSQTPWFYNPTLDVPFYLLATHAPAVVAGFALGAVQGLNFVLLFMLAYAALLIANPRHKVIVAAALALLGMLGGGGIALIGTTFYDNVTSIGLFLSVLLVILNYPRVMAEAWQKAFMLAALCGLPAGMAMGFKLPCFTFCTGLVAALLFLPGAMHRRLLIAFAFGTGIVVGVVITLGHWAWFLQTHFGSPFFPYFNDVFKAPLAPLSSARDLQYIPRSLHDFFLFPFIFTDSPFRTGEIPFRDWRIPLLYVLLPVAVVVRLIFGRSKNAHDAVAPPHITRYLLWVGTLSYFAWLIMFGIYRYVVAIEMLAPLLIVLAMGMLPVKPTPRALLTAFLLLIVAVSVQAGNWGRRTTWQNHFIEAEIPPLGNTSNTMLLMAGFEPYAHLATLFPPEIPVIRIQSNFSSPDQDKKINQLLHARVDSHRGRFLLLIPAWQHGLAAEALGYFHLAADWKACQTINDPTYDGTAFDLCPVSRVSE